MTLEVITAVRGPREPQLVAALGRAGAEFAVVRRCLDVVELLAVAASGRGHVVLVSPSLDGIDRDVVARLHGHGLRVVAVTSDAGWARAMGCEASLDAEAEDPGRLQAVLRAAAAGSPQARPHPAGEPGSTSADEPAGSPGPGRVVAVWGPAGAPGRTTVAVSVAAELATRGRRVMLIDADPYGGVVAPVLGLLDEAPGLAAACRRALRGALDAESLGQCASRLGDTFEVLTGIVQPARWPELRGSALDVVWQAARRRAGHVVVDCGFCLETGQGLGQDPAVPQRNAATLSALRHADEVLAVCAADPIGLQRFVRGLDELRELLPGVRPEVVVNRLRASVAGRHARRDVAEVLRRFAGVVDPVFLPDDPRTLDAAVLAGSSVVEAAPASPIRRAVAELADRWRVPAARGRAAGTPRRRRPVVRTATLEA